MSDQKLFGTDGVRDVAGQGLLSEDSVRRLGRAIAATLEERDDFGEEFASDRGRRVFVARDTRESGETLTSLLAEELGRAGFPMADLGVLPTPAAAWAAREYSECTLAVMISASHNPARDNGIKLLSPSGAKISDAFEARVTAHYFAENEESSSVSSASAATSDQAASGDSGAGAMVFGDEVRDAWIDFLISRCQRPERLRGKIVAIDAAHGAAYRVAAQLFEKLGMIVHAIGVEPDGQNINDGVGALAPQRLAEVVVESGACLGFCFDGDADRMIPVTGTGRVLDGDFVLALAGRHYRKAGLLPHGKIVSTVMSNVGLERALAKDGLELLRMPVGDRHVYRELVEGGHPFGGEQSGHLIFIDDFPTGDGLLAAVKLLDVLESDELDLETESRLMTKFPQVLHAVEVTQKVPIEDLPEVMDAVAEAERELADNGRVLVRYSGTEPIARVMVEGPEVDQIEALSLRICEAFEAAFAARC